MKKSHKKRLRELERQVRELVERAQPPAVVIAVPSTYTAPSTDPLWPRNPKIWCTNWPTSGGYALTTTTAATIGAASTPEKNQKIWYAGVCNNWENFTSDDSYSVI